MRIPSESDRKLRRVTQGEAPDQRMRPCSTLHTASAVRGVAFGTRYEHERVLKRSEPSHP